MLVHPPFRFSHVQSGVFRGSYPIASTFPFLKRLKLKTIISLTPGEIHASDKELQDFCRENSIQSIHFSVQKSKDGQVTLSSQQACEILSLLIDPTYFPVYLHCLNGINVTGLAVACLRKLQLWSLHLVTGEFARFTREESVSPDETEFLSNFNGTVPGSGLTNLINATVYFSNSENSINDNNVTSELPSPTVDAAEEQQQEDVMNCCIKTASQLPQWLWENGQVPDYFIKSVNYIADGEGGNSCQISYAHPYVRVQLHPAVLWQLASSTTLNIQQITPQANTQQQQQQQSQPQRDRNLQNSRELLGHVTSAPKSRPSSAAVNVGDDGKQQLGSQMFVRKSTVAVAEQEQTQAVSNSQSQSSLPGGEGQVTTGNKQVGDKSGEESAQDAAATGASQGKFSLALKALALEGL